jgi:acyl-coenzyme A thioesterase PaaI-like protein
MSRRPAPQALLERYLGTARSLKWLLNAYPPWLGSGIRVESLGDDLHEAVVALRMRWWNRNYVGTHFGGSLYSMCDPVFMLLLMQHLPRGTYEVWDKAATIRFRRPGRGTVRAVFSVPAALVADVVARVPHPGDRYDVDLSTVVTDEAGEVVAEVRKVIFVRRKR